MTEEEIEAKVLVALLRCAHAIDVELASELVFDEMTSREYLALRAVAASRQPVTPRDLAADLACGRTAASEVVGRLLRDGHAVTQESDRDRRSKIVVLTERGERARGDAALTAQELMIALLEGVTVADVDTLYRLLRHLSRAALFRRNMRFWGDTLRTRRPFAGHRPELSPV